MTPLYDEERLGEAPPPPAPRAPGWVRAAQELPRARRSLDEIVARAEADLEFRAALIADLESALAQARATSPDRRLVDELRERLAES